MIIKKKWNIKEEKGKITIIVLLRYIIVSWQLCKKGYPWHLSEEHIYTMCIFSQNACEYEYTITSKKSSLINHSLGQI